VSMAGVLAAVIASATAVWAPVRPWAIATPLVAGPEASAAGLHARAASAAAPACGVEVLVEAVVSAEAAVSAGAVAGGK
jgi:hypothetical protein